MGHFFDFVPGLESHSEGVEDEVEYSQFLQLSPEQFGTVVARYANCRNELFAECKLPVEGEGKSRLRYYLDATEDEQFELTTKVKSDVVKGKLEDNKFISKMMFKSLNTLASSVCLRRRYYIPIGDKVRRNGNPLEWELDVYFTSDGEKLIPSLWVKLELEVDIAALDDVVKLIPFDYENLILSDTTEETGRAQIAHLYDSVYNIKDRVNLLEMGQVSNSVE